MSDAIAMTPLATITRVEGLGMILIRARLDTLADAVARGAGLAIPGPTRATRDRQRWLGWMSPDELLLVLPHAEVGTTVAALTEALAGRHSLVMDVSDMRCVHDVAGPRAGHVLAKLCPVDLAGLPGDAVRRTRAAQVACAFWRQGEGYRIVAFRAVADYLGQVLAQAALPGTDLTPR